MTFFLFSPPSPFFLFFPPDGGWLPHETLAFLLPFPFFFPLLRIDEIDAFLPLFPPSPFLFFFSPLGEKWVFPPLSPSPFFLSSLFESWRARTSVDLPPYPFFFLLFFFFFLFSVRQEIEAEAMAFFSLFLSFFFFFLIIENKKTSDVDNPFPCFFLLPPPLFFFFSEIEEKEVTNLCSAGRRLRSPLSSSPVFPSLFSLFFFLEMRKVGVDRRRCTMISLNFHLFSSPRGVQRLCLFSSSFFQIEKK